MTTSTFSAFRAPHLRAASALALAALLSSIVASSTFAAPPVKPAEKPVDPRIPISAETTPGDGDSLFKITQPGSYYLTGNITGVDGKSGIEIGTANVTLDLNGFVLAGTVLAIDGIRVDAPTVIENVTIRNGSVTGWGRHGINLARHFSNETYAESSILENLQASRNFSDGIRASNNSTIRGCTSSHNAGYGIYANLNSVLEGCTAIGNWAGIGVWYGTARGCSASNNTTYGFLSYTSNLVDCTANSNDGAGFYATNGSNVKNSSSMNNAWGFEMNAGLIEGCTARWNKSGGIRSDGGSSIIGNVVNATLFDGTRTPGILVHNGATLVADNKVSSATIGIHIASGSHHRIEGNTLHYNETGLKVTGGYNLIIRNTARNTEGVNWDIAANNRAGAFVAPTLNGAINGNTGGNGSGTTDPFANLSF